MFGSDADGDITALTVPFEISVEPLRFDRLPDTRAQDPEVLRRLCGTYVMGPFEVVVAPQGHRDLDRAHGVGAAEPAKDLRVLRPGVW